jgi:glycosyltransferase involved in cell wall biosynthesis
VYGAAVKTGLKSCTKDWIFFTDSDGQFHYDELPKFAQASSAGDLIIGYRKKRMDPFHRVFVAQVLLKIWNFVLFGLTVRDVDCAFKLFKREIRDSIQLRTESAITVTELIVKAKTHGYRILQLPVTHYPRKFGDQTGGNWRVIARAARESFALYKELH